jgi:hypothetical protein
MPWFTSTDVVAEAGNPSSESLGFPDATSMDAHINTFLIPAAQSLIQQYLRKTYTDDEVPGGVRHAALSVAARGLIRIGVRKMGSLVRVGEWRVELASEDIFTQDLRSELDPFISRTTHTKSTGYQTDDLKQRWNE